MKRDVNLVFSVCRIDCFYKIFNLLSTSTMPSSTFSILIKQHGLLGTPDNSKLLSLKGRKMAILIFTINLIVFRCFRLAGLLRDVDAGCMGYTRGFQNLF